MISPSRRREWYCSASGGVSIEGSAARPEWKVSESALARMSIEIHRNCTGLHHPQSTFRALRGAGREDRAAGGAGDLGRVVIDDRFGGGLLFLARLGMPLVPERLKRPLGIHACDRKPVLGASGVPRRGGADDMGLDPRPGDHGAEFLHRAQGRFGQDGGIRRVAHGGSLSGWSARGGAPPSRLPAVNPHKLCRLPLLKVPELPPGG